MQTISKNFSLLLLLLLPIYIFSQNNALQIPDNKDINLHIQEIQKSIKKCKCCKKKDTFRLFTFFELFATDTIYKEEFEDGSFLKKLGYTYYYRPSEIKSIPILERKYFLSYKEGYTLGSVHYLCLKDKKVIARFSYRSRSFKCYKEPFDCFYIKELIRHVWDREYLFIFRMSNKPGDTYFIVNEQFEVYVFFNDYDSYYNMLPINEFIDKYWERFSREKGWRFVG